MNNDFLDPINSKAMPNLADSLFALDFLLTVKTGVRNCAVALTEAATPEARSILQNQLEDGIQMHEEITELMMGKGWLHPYNVNEQFNLDLKSAETTLKIADMQLFPDHTTRIGTFSAPEERQHD